jgi:hypothetical protein
MAVFRSPSVSAPEGFQRIGTDLRKIGGHIPNSVAGTATILLMLYLIENSNFICLVEVRLLESNLLGVEGGSLNGSGQLAAFR